MTDHSQSKLERRMTTVLLIVSLLLAGAIAVGMRYLNEDLFVSLCAGRDVFQGKLAEPDTWSFVTEGVVWVNQSRLSHLFFYISHRYLGAFGPVLLKVLLLGACIAVLAVRCRRQGSSWNITLIASALGTLAIAPFLQIRPENFGVLYFVVVTGFFAAPRRWGIARHVGALGVLLVWANSHGSFILFFVFVGLKVGLCLLLGGISAWIVHNLNAGRVAVRECVGWAITGIAGATIAAFANPYGLKNLTMPHRQLTSEQLTAISADWRPLLDWQAIQEGSLFHPTDVVPFLVFTAIVCALIIAAFFLLDGVELRNRALGHLEDDSRWDQTMEFVVPLVMLSGVFMYRRILLFAGLSLVPSTALLFTAISDPLRKRLGMSGIKERDPAPYGAGLYAALIAVMATGYFFYQSTWIPYAPGNPVRPDGPVIPRIMSFDSFSKPAAEFLKKNNIKGRLFCGWLISDFVLFRVPGVRVFIDCRDQSIYPGNVFLRYFRIVEVNPSDPASIKRSMDLIEELNVNALVLQTNPKEHPLAVAAMKSGRWAAAYADATTFVLVPRGERAADDHDYRTMWHPDESSRVLSKAYRQYFGTGRLSPAVRSRLIEIVRLRADPNMYALLFLDARARQGCLDNRTKGFFVAELGRLIPNEPHDDAAQLEDYESAIRILELLKLNDRKCGSTGNPSADSPGVQGSLPAYDKMLKQLQEAVRSLKDRYLGYSSM